MQFIASSLFTNHCWIMSLLREVISKDVSFHIVVVLVFIVYWLLSKVLSSLDYVSEVSPQINHQPVMLRCFFSVL